ncbi:MAG: zinc-binding dehydrogenase, partial [Pseudomonadota bacterium]
GGANMTTSFAAAKLNGNIATTVALLEIDLTPAHFKGLSLHVVFMLIPMIHDVGREKHGAILTKLAEIVDAGGVIPLLDPSNFTLEQTGAAHAKLESGTAIGKVVISV